MKQNRNLPSGTRDKLFREANGAFELERETCEVFQKRGYQRVETPIVEFEEVFSSESASESSHYRFFDKKGRLLVLRPDMTLPIGRVVAATKVSPPLQLFYSGKLFRSNDEMMGEEDEQTQAGIEIIGYSSSKAEVECIISGVEVLKKLNIKNYHIELGHAVIYQEILSVLNLNEKDEENFRILLLNKSITGLVDFVKQHPSSLDAFICKLPSLFGEMEETIQEAKKLVDNKILIQAFEEVLKIKQRIEKIDGKILLTIDMGMVKIMEYYSGIMFRGYADLAPDYFLSGGRYNRLMEHFGEEPLPSVGLGINLDKLVALQYKQDLFPKLPISTTLIHYEESEIQQAEMLHQEIKNSTISLFDELEESLEFAKKWNYKTVIYLANNQQEMIEIKEEL